VVYDTRTYAKPNGSGELITVWNVSFQDAPGGVEDFEMEEEELMKAIKLYTDSGLWRAESQRNLASIAKNGQGSL
jgi:hypothetical protein